MNSPILAKGIMSALGIVVLLAPTAGAQPDEAGFQKVLAEYREWQSVPTARGLGMRVASQEENIIKLAARMERLPPVPEEARRFFVRGTTLFRAAKTAWDFEQSIQEFARALHEVPWWPEARFNLAVAYEAQADCADLASARDTYAEALVHLRLYALCRLPPSEARAAQDRIYTMEAKAEKAARDMEAAAQKTVQPTEEMLFAAERAQRIKLARFFCRQWQSQGAIFENDARGNRGDFQVTVDVTEDGAAVVVLTRIRGVSDATPFRFEGALKNAEIRAKLVTPRVAGESGSVVLQKAGGQVRATINFVSAGSTFRYTSLLD